MKRVLAITVAISAIIMTLSSCDSGPYGPGANPQGEPQPCFDILQNHC